MKLEGWSETLHGLCKVWRKLRGGPPSGNDGSSWVLLAGVCIRSCQAKQHLESRHRAGLTDERARGWWKSIFVCNITVLRGGIILQSLRDFVPGVCNRSLFVFYKQIQFLESLSSCAMVPVVPQAQGLCVHSSCSVTALLPCWENRSETSACILVSYQSP